MIAQSATESALYAIGSRVAEDLRIRSFLMRAKLEKQKSRTRYSTGLFQVQRALLKESGPSRKTRHIQLRYLFMHNIVLSCMLKSTTRSDERDPSYVFTQDPQTDMLKRHLQRVGIVA